MHRHAVHLVGIANARLDLGALLSRFGAVPEYEGEAVRLDERDRHVRRHQRASPLADLPE